jgi:hypothetical protein
MHVTEQRVIEEHEWIHGRAERITGIINEVREDLGSVFDTSVDPVTEPQYRTAVDSVFADGDLGLNVATIVMLLRDLDVVEDYPGFVIDELLGRELAGMIAGQQPLRMLGEATFHYTDSQAHEGENAGADDLDSALAAGFQTRLPGWNWTAGPSRFTVE